MAPIPDVLMKQVDEYVDSLAPQIQPRVATELDAFQKKTIDVLETQVIDAFRSLFDRDGKNTKGLPRRSGSPTNAAPGSHGVQSLPFADEIASLTRSFSSLTEEAGYDLQGIFELTEDQSGQGDSRSRGEGQGDSSRGAKAFLSAAVNAVQDHLEKGSGDQGFQLDGILGTIIYTVKDAARNPEEKARLISPEIKDKVGEKLRQQHAPIAEQFTRIALNHIKRWLRGNTSTRDIGDGAKGEIEDQVKDIVKGVGSLLGNLKHSKEGASRDFGDWHYNKGESEGEGSGGFSRVISDKLSTGLAKVHREVRIEFRKVLGGIEKQLFELLPDELQRPLEKVLGGNPFDLQLNKDQSSRGDRDLGDDIKDKLLTKIRSLMRKVQETLRESILGVVNGGHRKFERESWVFVQSMVEKKVQKYLPKVRISVPDDIGDEGADPLLPGLSVAVLLLRPMEAMKGAYLYPPINTTVRCTASKATVRRAISNPNTTLRKDTIPLRNTTANTVVSRGITPPWDKNNSSTTAPSMDTILLYSNSTNIIPSKGMIHSRARSQEGVPSRGTIPILSSIHGVPSLTIIDSSETTISNGPLAKENVGTLW